MLVEVQVVAPQWAATLVRQCREGGKELVQGQADPSTFPIAFLEQCCYQPASLSSMPAFPSPQSPKALLKMFLTVREASQHQQGHV